MSATRSVGTIGARHLARDAKSIGDNEPIPKRSYGTIWSFMFLTATHQMSLAGQIEAVDVLEVFMMFYIKQTKLLRN